MSITAIILSIKSFIEGTKVYWKGIKILSFILLIASLLVSVRTCQKAKEDIVNLQGIQKTQIENLNDSHQEEIIVATTNQQQKAFIQEKTIATLLDSLNIKSRHINNIKRVTLEKVVTKYVQELDTLYEFIEVTNTPVSFTKVIDDCLTVDGEFTPQGLRLQADRNITIFDFNYTKRRNLFGAKFLPKLGRNEIHQTLVTSCGDTVRNNQKIVFD